MTMPIVLIPGFMLDTTLWDEVVAALPPERLVIRASLQGQATMDDLVERIGDAAPDRFVLAGFSMGGYIARAVAHRFLERVAGVILIATSLRPDEPARQAAKDAARNALAAGTSHGVSRAAIRRTVHASRASDSALIERIHEMGVRMGPETFAAQLALIRPGKDIVPECPTLIVAGRDDRVRSVGEAEELQLAIPGSQLEIVDDTGHMIPLEQPEALVQCIEAWLTASGL